MSTRSDSLAPAASVRGASAHFALKELVMKISTLLRRAGRAYGDSVALSAMGGPDLHRSRTLAHAVRMNREAAEH